MKREDDAYHPLFFVARALLTALQRYLRPDPFLCEDLEQQGMGDAAVNDVDFSTACIERLEA